MSFVISQKQYLAPTEERIQYEPFIIDDTGFEVEKIDVNFGHPLYTTVADIFYIKSVREYPQILPIVPDGCMSMVFRNHEGEISGYICGVIDEIRKLEIKPHEKFIFIRFIPGAGYALIDGGANSITNKSVSLKDDIPWGEQMLSVLERETEL